MTVSMMATGAICATSVVWASQPVQPAACLALLVLLSPFCCAIYIVFYILCIINGFVLKLYDLNNDNDGYLKKDELFIWLKDSLIVDGGASVVGEYDDDIKVLTVV